MRASSIHRSPTNRPARPACTMSPVRSLWPMRAQEPRSQISSSSSRTCPALDASGPGGDATGFAAFGHVTEGMDVVRKIFESSVSPTKGTAAMKGQMLEPQIKIVKVRG